MNKINFGIIGVFLALIGTLIYVLQKYHDFNEFFCPELIEKEQIEDSKKEIISFKTNSIQPQQVKYIYYEGIIIKINKELYEKRKKIKELEENIQRLLQQGKDVTFKIKELQIEKDEYLESLGKLKTETKSNNSFLFNKSNAQIDSLSNVLSNEEINIEELHKQLTNLINNCNE